MLKPLYSPALQSLYSVLPHHILLCSLTILLSFALITIFSCDSTIVYSISTLSKHQWLHVNATNSVLFWAVYRSYHSCKVWNQAKQIKLNNIRNYDISFTCTVKLLTMYFLAYMSLFMQLIHGVETAIISHAVMISYDNVTEE